MNVKKIDIPKKIMMGGHIVDVEKSSDLINEGAMGETDYNAKRIKLSDTLKGSVEGEVFIHEVLEMANILAETDLSHTAIQSLAVFIHQALTVKDP